MMEEIMSEAVTVAGILALLIGFIMQGIKQLEVVNNKYLPLISMALGIILGAIIAVAFEFNVGIYIIAGFIGGASASGLYDGLTIKKGENK